MYTAVKVTIAVPNTRKAATTKNINKRVVFKNFIPFIDCISEINNMEIDNTKDTDVVLNMYNLIEYSENYS